MQQAAVSTAVERNSRPAEGADSHSRSGASQDLIFQAG